MNQEAIVFGIVALAALNLARIWGGSLKGKGGCGKCSGCGPGQKQPRAPRNSQSPQAPPLVQLQMNLKPKGE